MHGENALAEAITSTEKIFTNQSAPAESISVKDLEVMDCVKIDFTKNQITNGIDVVSFLTEAGIFDSKGNARKNVQGGGVSINRRKVENVQMMVNNSLLLHNKYILVQKGKKNYFLIQAV